MSLTIAFLGLTSMTGCIFGTDPIEGLWVFFVDADYTVTSESYCDENYNQAKCPDATSGGENPWTYTYEQDQDQDTFVAQIVGLGGGEAVMFVNDQILTGSKGDAGAWVFTYEDFLTQNDTREHEDGYRYSTSRDDTSTLRFRLDRSGGSFEGTMELVSSTERSWSETDVWDVGDVGVYSSDIPATSYLVGDGAYPDNDPNEADCSDGVCELSVSGTTQVVIKVTAEQTDVNNEGNLGALENDGDFGWNIGEGGVDTGF